MTTSQLENNLDKFIEECIAIRGNKAYDGSYAAPREAYRNVFRDLLTELQEKVESFRPSRNDDYNTGKDHMVDDVLTLLSHYQQSTKDEPQ